MRKKMKHMKILPQKLEKHKDIFGVIRLEPVKF